MLSGVLDALLRAFWVEGRPTHEREVTLEVLERVLTPEKVQKVMMIVSWSSCSDCLSCTDYFSEQHGNGEGIATFEY